MSGRVPEWTAQWQRPLDGPRGRWPLWLLGGTGHCWAILGWVSYVRGNIGKLTPNMMRENDTNMKPRWSLCSAFAITVLCQDGLLVHGVELEFPEPEEMDAWLLPSHAVGQDLVCLMRNCMPWDPWGVDNFDKTKQLAWNLEAVRVLSDTQTLLGGNPAEWQPSEAWCIALLIVIGCPLLIVIGCPHMSRWFQTGIHIISLSISQPEAGPHLAAWTGLRRSTREGHGPLWWCTVVAGATMPPAMSHENGL